MTAYIQEWDATMLEQHNLRQQLQNTRQELSHALYQGDGAIRVIARLKKERDEARRMLETVQRAPPAPAAAEPAEAAPEMTNGKRAAEDGTEGGGKRVSTGGHLCKTALHCTQVKIHFPSGLQICMIVVTLHTSSLPLCRASVQPCPNVIHLALQLRS